MKRRGVALLAALWLVVAIATVALQFSLDARERRVIGIGAAERGVARAAASGALAFTQARLEQVLRQFAPSNISAIRNSRLADPWLDADSLFSGITYVDSMPVEVHVHDLGAQLNVNQLNETELQTFFQFALGNFTLAQHLAQSIMDWRDADSIPRTVGAERDTYIKKEKLALPTNAPFLELEELLNVDGMTPEIYAIVSPYLSIRGSNRVNVNSAPPLVLRCIPGMTDATLSRILSLRSQGRRIDGIDEIFSGGTGPAGRPRPGQVQSRAAQQQFQQRITVMTQELELDIIARAGPQAPPTRLRSTVTRNGNTGLNITWKAW